GRMRNRHIGRFTALTGCRGRSNELEQVQLARLIQPRLDATAGESHFRDVDRTLHQVTADFLDHNARDVDVVVGTALGAYAEPGDGGVVHVHGECHRAGSAAEVVVALESDDVRGYLEGQAVAQVVPRGARLEIRYLKDSARGKRRQAHGAVPHQPLALRRGG